MTNTTDARRAELLGQRHERRLTSREREEMRAAGDLRRRAMQRERAASYRSLNAGDDVTERR